MSRIYKNFLFSFFNAICTLITAAIAYYQFQYNIVSDRPWVEILREPELAATTGSFDIGDPAITSADFGLKNFGQSPALNVEFRSNFVLQSKTQDNLRQMARDICGQIRVQRQNVGFSVMPNNIHEFPGTNTVFTQNMLASICF